MILLSNVWSILIRLVLKIVKTIRNFQDFSLILAIPNGKRKFTLMIWRSKSVGWWLVETIFRHSWNPKFLSKLKMCHLRISSTLLQYIYFSKETERYILNGHFDRKIKYFQFWKSNGIHVENFNFNYFYFSIPSF